MKNLIYTLVVSGFLVSLSACTTPDRNISDVRLGMTQDEVQDAMGDPFAIRAAKVFENEEWTEVWEYRPPIISLAAITDKYDRRYFIFFENGKVVQWGEPGDFYYGSTLKAEDELPIVEYNEKKQATR